MCKICKEFNSKKIDSAEAYKRIDKALKLLQMAGKEEYDAQSPHLMQLSDAILDSDIPMKETDPELEAAYWKSTHKASSDGE